MADNSGSTKQKGVKQKGELKTARIPIKIVPVDEPLRKPEWIRVKAGNSAGRFGEIKAMLREKKLHTVCAEKRSGPPLGKNPPPPPPACFGAGPPPPSCLGAIPPPAAAPSAMLATANPCRPTRTNPENWPNRSPR